MLDSSFYLKVKVNPNCKKANISTLSNGTLKINVKAKPEKGKANQEVIETLAQYFKTKKSQIKIISGHTEQIKLVKISNEFT